MFSLRPKNYTMESINDKYRFVFARLLKVCKMTANSSCPTVWWYNACVGNQVIGDHTVVPCPFYKDKVTLRCKSNNQWNGTELMFFDLCNGKQFLFRTLIEKYFGFFVYPLQMILLLTSIFKISIFDEMVKDFCWRMIIWSLKAKTIKYTIGWILALMNSNYVVATACIALSLIPVLADFFSLACEMALFFYVYIILFRFDVQIRTIKSALFRVTVMTPFLAIIVCLVLDLNTDDNYNYFECQTDIFGSRILHAYLTIYFAVTIILFYLWIAISRKINEMRNEVQIGTYRMEYDIIGARKEISRREIFRVRYVLNWILAHSMFDSIVLSSTIYQTIYETPRKYYFIIMASTLFILILGEAITVLAIIWMNTHFRERHKALKLWYVEINEEKNLGQEEEDFKTALKETTDENAFLN